MERVGEWVARFYPDVSVIVDGGTARLVSDERDAPALRLIWRSALANEALLARGSSRRSAVIGSLLR